MIKTIITFLLIFSLIVIIHEYGHFFFARRAGILVREFSIGMGPKLFSRQARDKTTYTIRMLPLGGYVRMAGLDEDEGLEPGRQIGLIIDNEGIVQEINLSDKTRPDELPVQVNSADLTYDMKIEVLQQNQADYTTYSVSKDASIIEEDGTILPVAPAEVCYESASVWNKIKTNLAGPLSNFVLAVIVFCVVGFSLPGVGDESSILGQVQDNSPAQAAGLKEGDQVLSIDGQEVSKWNELTTIVRNSPEKELDFKIKRDSQDLSIKVTPKKVVDENSDQEYGQIGVQASLKTDFWSRIKYGFTQAWAVVSGVFGTIIHMFKKGFSLDYFGGPVAMADMTNQVVKSGLIPILNFTGMLSANLGVFNLLPIPALDGGKVVFNVIESIRGKPVSKEKEGIVTLIGVLLLLVLMVLVTWNDIKRAFF